MRFDEIVKEEFVFVKKNFKSNKETISFLSKQLQEKGFVKESFLEAVLKREKEHPTGLYLGKINVAIPHTDVKYVLKPGIAVATLKEPVAFGKMDEPEKKIPVHIVFLLAVQDPKGYVKFLAKLTRSFGSNLFISSIYSSESSEKLKSLLLEIFKEEGRQ